MKNSGIASVLCALLLVLEPGLKAGFVNQGAKIYDAGKYPFVRRDLNGIDNGQQGLRDFYRRLEMLEKGDLRKINVVHIGDSHLQADWFSGAVRMALQKRFGSAGRGLVFPYRIAKTNSPEDITAYTNASWNTRRTVQSYGKLPIGISGITANTFDSNYALRVSLGANDHNIDYRFNKVTLFSDKGPRIYDMKVGVGGSAQSWKPRPTSQSSETGQKAAYHRVNRGETLSSISRKYGLSIRRLQELNRMRGTTIYAGQRLLVRHGSKGRTSTPIASPPPPPGKYEALVKLSSRSLDQFTSTVYLEEPVSSIVFKGSKNEAIQQKMTLYGMVLENHEQTGILYHMIGVNGAQFRHYNGARYFHEQLESLDPDLVIVSLGTNEANSGFQTNTFFRDMDTFIHDLETHLPHANILITTPADALKARRYPNAAVGEARNLILDYTMNNGLSCWDFYEVMGGFKSIQDWHKAGLAQQDRLHLTRRGYELQAELLYEALMSEYERFATLR